MQALTLSLRNFNDRIKTMNQTNSKQLILTADEARNLHNDIFSLLNTIAELQTTGNKTDPTVQISMDGGLF